MPILSKKPLSESKKLLIYWKAEMIICSTSNKLLINTKSNLSLCSTELQNSQENTCDGILFLVKLQSWPTILLKKNAIAGGFFVNFTTIFRTHFLQNISKRLFLMRSFAIVFIKWHKVFQSAPSIICERQPLKKIFKFFKGCIPQILLGPLLNT